MADNFSGQKLKGRSFRGKDLRSANFTQADIRGADFSGANLSGAIFFGARSGLRRRRYLMLFVLAFALVIASTLFLVLLAFIFSALALGAFPTEEGNEFQLPQQAIIGVSGILPIISYLTLTFKISLSRGAGRIFLIVLFGIPILFLGLYTVTVAASYILGNPDDLSEIRQIFLLQNLVLGIIVGFFSSLLLFIIDIWMLLSLACVYALNKVLAYLSIACVELICASIVIYLSVLLYSSEDWSIHIFSAFGLGLFVFTLFMSHSLFVVRRSFINLKMDRFLYKFAIAYSASGGTSFYKSNLESVDFGHYNFRSSDFRSSRLKKNIFTNITNINHARWGDTLLEKDVVRKLITSNDASGKSFQDIIMMGINLRGKNLVRSSFRGANLIDSDLSHTTLRFANLAGLQAAGADFTSADLTGACIQNWSIDDTTKLENVKCDFVYLLESPNNRTGSRERRPHNPDKIFQPGDFQKLYSRIMHTVQFLFRYGEDSQAFASAFKILSQEYLELSMTSIEKIDEDYLFTAAVSASTNKEDLAKKFEIIFREKCIENQKTRQNLSAAIDCFDQSIGIIRILLDEPRIQNTSYNISAQDGGKAIMSNFINTNITTGEGGVFNTGSIEQFGGVINLGEISGDVSNVIGRLPKEKAELRQLLIQLHQAIGTSDIKEEYKAMAFEELKALSQIANGPSTPETSRKARKILTFMKGLLPTAANIATVVSAIFPFFA